MIREEIKNLIKKSIKELYKIEAEVSVEHPENKEYGDYSTNIAMLLKKNPQEIADVIKSPLLEKIEVKNGFINFFISKEYLQKQVGEILKQKEFFGNLKTGMGQKVDIESVSANPTGPLHIGNGRNTFAGDVLANVLGKAGYEVVREYFVNDAKNSKQIIELGKTALGRGTTYLNDYLKSKIQNPKFKIKIQNTKLNEGEVGFLLAQGVQSDTKNFLEKKLKIQFDRWVSEEEDIYRKSKIKKNFEWLKKKNLIYQKDGAWWLKTSQFGAECDWVVVRESGEPTYLLSDISYHKDKFDKKYDKIINIWGADHQAHVSKIKAAAKILGFKGSLDILVLQLVTLRGGEKMSKRTGKIITLEELVQEIGLDVARWFYLQKSLGTHMDFDLDLAKEQSEKNPVYYVQYAHARICSILSKFGKGEIRSTKFETLKLLSHPSELNLIKQLIRFPEIIEDTSKDYQVQRIPQYAIDLATAFHQFYRDCRVISEDKNLTQVRLALVSASKIVIKNTLNLMGVTAPEKM